MWFWEVYLFDCTGSHHPLRSGPEHKLPRVLPPQYDLLNQYPPVWRVTIFVQNLRRHSFNEQSFSNNDKTRFPPWINFEDLILWGISNLQSQVGGVGKGEPLPSRREEGSMGGNRGERIDIQSWWWFLFISAGMMFWGPDLKMGSHCWLSWGRQVLDTGAGSQAN